MTKSAPFQIAGKLWCKRTDNGCKQVQITYLALNSNLDEVVQTRKFKDLGMVLTCLLLVQKVWNGI